MNQLKRRKDRERNENAAMGCVWGLGTWVILVAVSFVVEFLISSVSGGSGSGAPGMAPIPIVAASAIFLGWIPAVIVGLWKYRQEQP